MNSYYLKAFISTDSFHSEDTFKFSYRAECIVAELLKESHLKFKEYLKTGTIPEELACHLLAGFYSQPPSIMTEIFGCNEYEKTQAIVTQEDQFLPPGISYEIFPYGLDLNMTFKFEYDSEEDDINREKITVNITFQE